MVDETHDYSVSRLIYSDKNREFETENSSPCQQVKIPILQRKKKKTRTREQKKDLFPILDKVSYQNFWELRPELPGQLVRRNKKVYNRSKGLRPPRHSQILGVRTRRPPTNGETEFVSARTKRRGKREREDWTDTYGQ